MKFAGLANALERARLNIVALEIDRAEKVASIYDLVGQAKQLAIALERGEAQELYAETLAAFIDTARELEAELGMNEIGRVDIYDVLSMEEK